MPELGLGTALRALRERRDLNVREVAKLADVDHAYIYRLESGEKTNPSEDMLVKLLRTLKANERDATFVRWLASHPDTDPGLVIYALDTTDVEFEIFTMAAGVRHRGHVRPDPATLIKRARMLSQEPDDE